MLGRTDFHTQVSNAADAIKMACDFISVHNIRQTRQLIPEFRLHRLATGWGDDVLQFYATLWYAWKSLFRMRPSLAFAPPNPDPSGISIGGQAASISSPFNLTAVNDIPLSSVTAPSIPLSAVLHCEHTQASNLSSATPPRRQSRKEKNLARRAHAVAQRPSKPWHIYTCPICLRKLNRNGFIDHLYALTTTTL